MCRDRHPEISWKSGQIWQNDLSGRGDIWQFGFSQGPGGAGIHPGGFVLMSGPQKPNYFLILAIWGSVRAYFPILSYYLGVPPGPLLAPIGSYWLLLAPMWEVPTHCQCLHLDWVLSPLTLKEERPLLLGA